MGGTMDQTDRTESIPVKLANGTTVKFQVSQPEAGRQDVADIGDLLSSPGFFHSPRCQYNLG